MQRSSNMQTANPPLIMAPDRRSLRNDLLVGAVSGQIAGLVMAMAMVAVFALFLGKPVYYPVQVIGSFVFGDAALVGFQLPAFLTGLALHQGVASLIWGIVFGLLVHQLQPRGAAWVALALGVGIVSEILDVGLLVPAIMNARFGHNIWAENVPRFWDWASHLIFGLSFLVFPWVNARFFRRAE